MKSIIFLIAMTTALPTFAWKETSPRQQEYTFKYTLGSEKIEIKRSAASYEEAFDTAAQDCFKHFKGGQKLSEDRGLDIIDVCANPRS